MSKKPIEKQIEEVFTHIQKQKHFKPKVAKGIKEELNVDDTAYYKKYLQLQLTAQKENNSNKDKKNARPARIAKEYKVKPAANYNTLLCLAFTLAEKLYTEFRNKALNKNQTNNLIQINENVISTTKTDENLSNTLSPIECLKMSTDLMRGQNVQLLKQVKQNDVQAINEYVAIEDKVYKAIKELRNYHAHIFHEDGPLHFEDRYATNNNVVKDKLSQEDWNTAKHYFGVRFNEAQAHQLKKVENHIQSINENTELKHWQKKVEINKAKEQIEKINSIPFYANESNMLSREALLFIACMYLRADDANYIIKKWTGIKLSEGVQKNLPSFFSYYSLKASKSINTLNFDLFKYRQIIAQLSTIPYTTNEHLISIYNQISLENEVSFNELDEENDIYKNELKDLKNKRLNKFAFEEEKKKLTENHNSQVNKITSYIMPVRKTGTPVKWYVDYLLDNDLLKEFEIACYKTYSERATYFENHGIYKNIKEFKAEIGLVKDSTEKKKLRSIYNEAKKNFSFRSAAKANGLINDDVCVKNNNIFLKYQPTGFTNPIHITVSHNILLKWVFLHYKKQINIDSIIKDYVTNYSKNLLMDEASIKFISMYNLPKNKIYPSSLINAIDKDDVENLKATTTLSKLERKIKKLNENLEHLFTTNKLQRRPWSYASKQKIDVILKYVHFSFCFNYLKKAFANGISEKEIENTIRHTALSDFEYLDVFELIRFFGKTKDTKEFKEKLKGEYFNSIAIYLVQSTRLEELYEAVHNDFVKLLRKLNLNDPLELKVLVKLFNAEQYSLKENIHSRAKEFAYNISLSHELIDIKKQLNTDASKIEGFVIKDDTKKISDFFFIRKMLEQEIGFTNTDYLMKQILPVVIKKEKREKVGASLLNLLNEFKTEELVLAIIAKYYWKKAYGNELDLKNCKPYDRNNGEDDYVPYRSVNPYSELFNKTNEIKYVSKINKLNSYTLSISPKKFDDEFQYYEQNQIVDYLDFYKPNTTVIDYESINKEIKNQLADVLDDIYLLMDCERKLLLEASTKQKVSDNLINAYKKNGELELYVIFDKSKKDNSRPKNDVLINDYLFNALNHQNKFDRNDLASFRNKSLHRQLQEPATYLAIKTALWEFCFN